MNFMYLRGTKTTFLTPKRYEEQPRPFFYGSSRPPGGGGGIGLETMYNSYLIPTDMELEEVTPGEEETLRPQVRKRSDSKKNFKF